MDAIGVEGEERRYAVTDDALACLRGCDRRRPRRACLRDRARLGDDRAGLSLGRLGGCASARRPLRARHRRAPAARGGYDAVVARDAARAARPTERLLARDQDGDAHRGRRARKRAVRDRVLPRRRGERERRRARARAPARASTARARSPRSRYPVAEDQTVRYSAASGDDFAIHLDDEFARRSGCPGRSSTASARWRSPAAPCSRRPLADPRAVRRLAVRFSAPLFPGETVTTRVWRVDGGYGFEALDGGGHDGDQGWPVELR